MNCKKFEFFFQKNGEELTNSILEEFCDMLWAGEKERKYSFSGKKIKIKILDIYCHDVINKTVSGVIEIDNEEIGFIIEDGNNSGTVVLEWGDVGLYDPPKPILRTFIPKDDFLEQTNPNMYKVYLNWQEQKWFKDNCQKMNYDFHFQPGGKTHRYYSQWAEKKGMKIGFESVEGA